MRDSSVSRVPAMQDGVLVLVSKTLVKRQPSWSELYFQCWWGGDRVISGACFQSVETNWQKLGHWESLSQTAKCLQGWLLSLRHMHAVHRQTCTQKNFLSPPHPPDCILSFTHPWINISDLKEGAPFRGPCPWYHSIELILHSRQNKDRFCMWPVDWIRVGQLHTLQDRQWDVCPGTARHSITTQIFIKWRLLTED